jgi:hypothetical protein
MTPQNEPQMLNDKPLSAWEAAAVMGIDMSTIEQNLRLSPDERMHQHDCRLTLVLLLERILSSAHQQSVKSS